MKLEYYNPEEGNCIYRALSKALNKKYSDIKKELKLLAQSLNVDDYLDDIVFDTYLLNNNFIIDNSLKDTNIFNNNYKGINILYTYDKDWYHLVCIIDNVIYDSCQLSKLENLKVIKIYNNLTK